MWLLFIFKKKNLRFLWERVGESCASERVSVYHALLSTCACQSAACDLTTGSKSESASGHQMGPRRPPNTHTHAAPHWACMFLCLWICKTTASLSGRVCSVQIRVSPASLSSPPLSAQEKHGVSGRLKRETVMLHSLIGLIHFQALLPGPMASFIKGPRTELCVRLNPSQRCKSVCSFYSVFRFLAPYRKVKVNSLLFIAQGLQKLYSPTTFCAGWTCSKHPLKDVCLHSVLFTEFHTFKNGQVLNSWIYFFG